MARTPMTDEERKAKRDAKRAEKKALIAAAKAELRSEIARLVNHVPATVRGGCVQQVRAWKSVAESAHAAANSDRTSVNRLKDAIAELRPFYQ